MQQRLGGGLLINVEAEIVAIIICLEGFLGLNVPIVGTPWIIPGRYLEWDFAQCSLLSILREWIYKDSLCLLDVLADLIPLHKVF